MGTFIIFKLWINVLNISIFFFKYTKLSFKETKVKKIKQIFYT